MPNRWKTDLNYLYNSKRVEEEDQFRHVTYCTDAGSVYTAVVATNSTIKVRLTGLSVFNPGNAAATVRAYVAGGTGPSNVLATIVVPAAEDHGFIEFGHHGIDIPEGLAILVGVAGQQSGQPTEVILYGYHGA